MRASLWLWNMSTSATGTELTETSGTQEQPSTAWRSPARSSLQERIAANKPYLRHGNKAMRFNNAKIQKNWGAKKMATCALGPISQNCKCLAGAGCSLLTKGWTAIQYWVPVCNNKAWWRLLASSGLHCWQVAVKDLVWINGALNIETLGSYISIMLYHQVGKWFAPNLFCSKKTTLNIKTMTLSTRCSS